MNGIRKLIIEMDEIFKANLNYSFESFIQKFAEPLVYLFLQCPRSKEKRMKVIKKYEIDLQVLDKNIGENKKNEEFKDIELDLKEFKINMDKVYEKLEELYVSEIIKYRNRIVEMNYETILMVN